MSATMIAVRRASTEAYEEIQDPFLFKRARVWWTLLALCLMAQGNAAIFSAPTVASEARKTLRELYAPSTTLLILTVVLYLICASLIGTRIGPTLRMMLNQKAVLAFAILAFLSTLWSQEPSLTFRKAAMLFLTFAFAWLFAISYSPADQMRILLVAGVILALSSFAMAVLLPAYGVEAGGEWKGVFGQKNTLGYTMFLLFSGLAFDRIPSRRRLMTVTLQAILPIGLIVLSQSRESLVLAVLLIGVRVYGPFLARRRRDQLPFTLYATVFGILGIIFAREILFSVLGRDSTLTGRTNEWAIIVPFALKHLWLGYGYQAFWTGTGDSLGVISALRGAIFGADSGYLDTMLQFGLVGLGLLLILLVVSLGDFARLFRTDSMPLAAYWYAGLILAAYLGNFVGSMFLSTGFNSFVFVVACAGLRNLSHENASLPRS